MQRSIIGLMLTLALSLLMGPRATNAQQPGHVPRIAVLNAGFPPAASASTPFRDAFRHELRERGWVEGHTSAIEWRWAEGSLDRFASLVAEVIRLPVEVLVVPNTTTARLTNSELTP